jgi:hypothetical protein
MQKYPTQRQGVWNMDQRDYPRVCLHAEASIRNGEKNFQGMLANLSLTGVYIRTDNMIPVGDNAEVIFCDSVSTRKAAVKANGKVVRTDEKGMAFRLLQMDVDSFINLHLIVAKQAATV